MALTSAFAAAGYASTVTVQAEERNNPLPSSKALVIGIFGPPGSGKTTQANKMVDAFDMKLVEVGREDELRKRVGELARKGRARVLLDGFPSTLDEAKWFQSRIAKLAFLVYMDTPADDISKRTSKEAKDSHAAFHRDAESLVKEFRDQGNILEIAGEMSEDEVWDMAEHKVDQCLQLDERGELEM